MFKPLAFASLTALIVSGCAASPQAVVPGAASQHVADVDASEKGTTVPGVVSVDAAKKLIKFTEGSLKEADFKAVSSVKLHDYTGTKAEEEFSHLVKFSGTLYFDGDHFHTDSRLLPVVGEGNDFVHLGYVKKDSRVQALEEKKVTAFLKVERRRFKKILTRYETTVTLLGIRY